jgi:hypothetical protein
VEVDIPFFFSKRGFVLGEHFPSKVKEKSMPDVQKNIIRSEGKKAQERKKNKTHHNNAEEDSKKNTVSHGYRQKWVSNTKTSN